MNNYTLESLGLSDPTAAISEITQNGGTLYIHIRKNTDSCFCPNCSHRMLSKGWQKERAVKGVGMINGYHLQYVLHQRKWFCPECHSYLTDSFTFVDSYKQTTNRLPYMIAQEMKELNVTAAQIARRFDVSDTYVIYAFMSVVNLPRLPLTDIICIDEVYMDYGPKKLYPMILMDFRTGEPIDIVESRRIETTASYLYSIPIEERRQVRFIICDMYESYIRFAGSFFPNAVAVVDSFHVIAKFNSGIRSYVHHVKSRYKKRDRELLEQQNYETNRNHRTKKESKEVFLLNHYIWFLLKNEDEIENWHERRYISSFGMYMDLFDLRNAFMNLDQHFEYILKMKNKYVEFNRKYVGKPDEAAVEFDQLVTEYEQSPMSMFRELSETLKRYRAEILASFNTIETIDPNTGEVIQRRLSNGPMESFNNFPKDLKRESNGVSNPEYTRLRILWATRNNPQLLAVPRPLSEVKGIGKPRGKYKK